MARVFFCFKKKRWRYARVVGTKKKKSNQKKGGRMAGDGKSFLLFKKKKKDGDMQGLLELEEWKVIYWLQKKKKKKMERSYTGTKRNNNI
jgi:hypothetical protein